MKIGLTDYTMILRTLQGIQQCSGAYQLQDFVHAAIGLLLDFFSDGACFDDDFRSPSFLQQVLAFGVTCGGHDFNAVVLRYRRRGWKPSTKTRVSTI